MPEYVKLQVDDNDSRWMWNQFSEGNELTFGGVTITIEEIGWENYNG